MTSAQTDDPTSRWSGRNAAGSRELHSCPDIHLHSRKQPIEANRAFNHE